MKNQCLIVAYVLSWHTYLFASPTGALPIDLMGASLLSMALEIFRIFSPGFHPDVSCSALDKPLALCSRGEFINDPDRFHWSLFTLLFDDLER